VAEAEFFDDRAGMAPVDEFFLDFVAPGVMADDAAAGMKFEIGAKGIGGSIWFHVVFLWLAGGQRSMRFFEAG